MSEIFQSILFLCYGQLKNKVSLCGGQILFFVFVENTLFEPPYMKQITRLDYLQVVFKTMSHSLRFLQCRKITIVGIVGKCLLLLHIYGMGGMVYIVKLPSLSPISYISSIHTKLKNFKKIIKISSTLSSNKSSKINNFPLLFYC